MSSEKDVREFRMRLDADLCRELDELVAARNEANPDHPQSRNEAINEAVRRMVRERGRKR